MEMEIPEFCTRRTRRVTRKRKTEEEADPDYFPDGGGDKEMDESSSSLMGTPTLVLVGGEDERSALCPPKKKPWEERNKICRSKLLAEELSKPVPELQFIERPEFSVEDWREKAEESRKRREVQKMRMPRKKKVAEEASAGGKKVGRGTNAKKTDDDDSDDENGDGAFDFKQLQPILHELDPVTQYLEKNGINADNFDLKNLPKFVMGTGKGEPGGPPAFEFKSLWNYDLPPLSVEHTEEAIFENLPWNKSDVTKPDVQPGVLSVVACFFVGRKLDLKEIANNTRNVEYKPERCAPLIMRIRDPKTTALIFASGKIIVTGAKSVGESKFAARKFARVIQKLGYKVSISNFHIQNVSAHCHLNFRVRLHHLCKNKLYGRLSYEPELFPGLIIPLEHPHVKVIIFCTGSVIMTGAKSEADVETALNIIYPLVKMYGH